MVRCDTCKDWFHRSCCPTDVIKNKIGTVPNVLLSHHNCIVCCSIVIVAFSYIVVMIYYYQCMTFYQYSTGT